MPEIPNPILSVGDLNRAIASSLQDQFDSVWVSGEVSNFKAYDSGHWYFSLKDEEGQIRCVMFRGKNAQVGFMPQSGDLVEVGASLGLYIPRPQAAALKDVLSTLSRRAPHIPIVIYPTLVQGPEAPLNIIAALEHANREAVVDVILLVRGGGSIEDLWAFNHEQLAAIVGFNRLDVFTYLNAIGANVLNRRRAHRTRNQCEVLQTR
jgi:exodeoxyribonuclease VII large subunit